MESEPPSKPETNESTVVDMLAELAALLEEELGPVSEEVVAEAESAWPDQSI